MVFLCALMVTVAAVTVCPQIARTSGMDVGKVIFLLVVLLDIPVIAGAMLGGRQIDKFGIGKV
jgi:predicted MFS family arabinose efflux permease